MLPKVCGRLLVTALQGTIRNVLSNLIRLHAPNRYCLIQLLILSTSSLLFTYLACRMEGLEFSPQQKSYTNFLQSWTDSNTSNWVQGQYEDSARQHEMERSMFNQDLDAAMHAISSHKESVTILLQKTHTAVSEISDEIMCVAWIGK